MSVPLPELPVKIRSFLPVDLRSCRTLYREGLIGGKLAENDTGLDIDDIESTYMQTAGNHFWVAETLADGKPPEIVGMIGVQHHEQDAAEIRRLRVGQTARRRGVGSKLVEAALRFCQEQDYLKVTLDTFVERDAAIKLFEKFQFRHSRSRQMHGKELLYFYLDIYGTEQRDSASL